MLHKWTLALIKNARFMAACAWAMLDQRLVAMGASSLCG